MRGGELWTTWALIRQCLRRRDCWIACARQLRGVITVRGPRKRTFTGSSDLSTSPIADPEELGAAEVTAFLNHLARERKVAAATQNQALAALLFLYKEMLAQPLPWLEGLDRAKRPVRVPAVLTREEVERLLAQMRGTKRLMASLLYGAGLRLRECLKLRVKDVDFGYRQITVRDGKGAKDRVTMLPAQLVEPLRQQLERVRRLHECDVASGMAMSSCRTRSRASIRARRMSGPGSSSFLRIASPSTRARAPCAATTSTRTS